MPWCDLQNFYTLLPEKFWPQRKMSRLFFFAVQSLFYQEMTNANFAFNIDISEKVWNYCLVIYKKYNIFKLALYYHAKKVLTKLFIFLAFISSQIAINQWTTCTIFLKVHLYFNRKYRKLVLCLINHLQWKYATIYVNTIKAQLKSLWFLKDHISLYPITYIFDAWR